MIPRYTRPGMAALWSDEERLSRWWRVELAACEGMAKAGQIPHSAVAELRTAKLPSVEQVDAIERVTRHDVAAFVKCMEEQVGPEVGKYIHLGLTSSDVLDTALATILRDALDLLDGGLEALAKAVRKRAFEHKRTPVVGRSHGIHAEPTTFGLVLAVWYAEIGRHRDRLREVRGRIAVGKVSGAVGNFSDIDPAVEAWVCAALGLTAEPAASQVVQRDRHAEFFSVLALIASSLEKFAVQIRHWQRTEVLEAEEPFGAGQKGSSAMPHKKNPVLSENITGLCRLIRSYAIAAMEDVALWHERDISHSSVERVIGPDATIALDFVLARLANLVENLVVHAGNMRRNLEQTRGLVFSGRLLVRLIHEGGCGREEAYQLVQQSALRSFHEGLDFRQLVSSDPAIGAVLTSAQIDACFDLERALGEVDVIFERVFGTEGQAA